MRRAAKEHKNAALAQKNHLASEQEAHFGVSEKRKMQNVEDIKSRMGSAGLLVKG